MINAAELLTKKDKFKIKNKGKIMPDKIKLLFIMIIIIWVFIIELKNGEEKSYKS